METQEQIDALRVRIERIEEKLAEEHKANNFGNIAIPETEPQYEEPDFIPDWKDAPAWANFLVMGSRGGWCWAESRPYVDGSWWKMFKFDKHMTSGRCDNADRLHPDYWKNSLQERPKPETHDNSQYADLLPDGYEFCAPGDATMWIKVESGVGSAEPGQMIDNKFFPDLRPEYQKAYRAIRIKPVSYEVDWSEAPEWAEFHAWDGDERGYWYGLYAKGARFVREFTGSKFPFPGGDWKDSKTRRPL